MDDAKIGEGRKEAEVFTQKQIEQMGESVSEEMLLQLNLKFKLKTGDVARQRTLIRELVRRLMLLQLGYAMSILCIQYESYDMTMCMKHISS